MYGIKLGRWEVFPGSDWGICNSCGRVIDSKNSTCQACTGIMIEKKNIIPISKGNNGNRVINYGTSCPVDDFTINDHYLDDKEAIRGIKRGQCYNCHDTRCTRRKDF